MMHGMHKSRDDSLASTHGSPKLQESSSKLRAQVSDRPNIEVLKLHQRMQSQTHPSEQLETISLGHLE